MATVSPHFEIAGQAGALQLSVAEAVEKVRKRFATHTISVHTTAGNRDASTNAIIAKAHARGKAPLQKRDPWFIDKATMADIRFVLRAAASGGKWVRNTFRKVGKLMVRGVRLHFAQELNKRGHFPALTPRYAKWKQKRFPGKPILTATGELRRSLKVNIRRIRTR